MPIKTIDPNTLKKWIDNNEVTIIDVREPAEHRSQKITGAKLLPLGSCCCTNLPDTQKKIVIHCQKGMRGSKACEKLLAENNSMELYNLEGGIAAWQEAGFPIETSGRKILPLDRQVQLTIGICVLVGSILAYTIDPRFAFLTGFFGVGLIFAGLTGICGLAMFMAKMPWNR